MSGDYHQGRLSTGGDEEDRAKAKAETALALQNLPKETDEETSMRKSKDIFEEKRQAAEFDKDTNAAYKALENELRNGSLLDCDFGIVTYQISIQRPLQANMKPDIVKPDLDESCKNKDADDMLEPEDSHNWSGPVKKKKNLKSKRKDTEADRSAAKKRLRCSILIVARLERRRPGDASTSQLWSIYLQTPKRKPRPRRPYITTKSAERFTLRDSTRSTSHFLNDGTPDPEAHLKGGYVGKGTIQPTRRPCPAPVFDEGKVQPLLPQLDDPNSQSRRPSAPLVEEIERYACLTANTCIIPKED
ncbi:hypothetical protein MMC11_003800 [Xylographa trunciseda]|nr:hypothetical protein [Xylographa trunciseda]